VINVRSSPYLSSKSLQSQAVMEPPRPTDLDWTDIAAKAQTRLINSIPSEWRIPYTTLPKDDQFDVTGFPKQSGLLSDEELRITESFATDIVGAVAAGEWTAEEVTRAFCKRAAIAHQVVCPPCFAAYRQ